MLPKEKRKEKREKVLTDVVTPRAAHLGVVLRLFKWAVSCWLMAKGQASKHGGADTAASPQGEWNKVDSHHQQEGGMEGGMSYSICLQVDVS